jgi:predicted NACHT family NTPase
MARLSYGPKARQRAHRLLEALLTYANDDVEDLYNQFEIEFSWKSETKLTIKTEVSSCEALTKHLFKDDKLTGEQIKASLNSYKVFLRILDDHRIKKRGSREWHFTLKLWFGRHNKADNLKQFDEKWEHCCIAKTGSVIDRNSEPEKSQSIETAEHDDLVKSIRENVSAHIQARCGTMRVLDMSQPIELNEIYTTVNIYESISGRQRRRLTDLFQQFSTEDFRHLNQLQETRMPGLTAFEQYSKLMVLGKPGAGKTVFLKWLAIQCNAGHLRSDLIPVFIPVKAFAETQGQPTLLDYIHRQWGDLQPSQTEALLKQGHALILLDGLDEVKETDHDRVLQEILELSTQYHTCLFVMTCRIAAREYTFEQFTEVEIADFNDQQITDFITKWFATKHNRAQTSRVLKNLHDHQRLRDLATNPLLLTLLCLVFQESAAFPTNRSELYREGLELLLRKWDAKRNIERDGLYQRSDLYQNLSLQSKEALLSQIAFTTFERGEYLFTQPAIEQYITDFLLALPAFKDEITPLGIDSEAVLKSIEAQHGLLVERVRGIYSFAHLTFHEYFAAKQITAQFVSQRKEALQTLVSHVANKEWNEIFLLTVGMLKSADDLLLMMKAQIDGLLSLDAELQKFLVWLNGRAIYAASNPTKPGLKYKLAVIRAYHSFLIFENVDINTTAIAICSAVNRTSLLDDSARNISSASDNKQAMASIIASASDNERAIAIAIGIAISMNSTIESVSEITTAILNAVEKAISLTVDSELEQSLQAIKTQLPDPNGDQIMLQQWWGNFGHAWTTQLRDAQIQFRNLVPDCQFNKTQITLLEQYYRANLLLVNCLYSDCNVSLSVKDEIESTLFLSIQDIEQHKHSGRNK